MKNFQTQRLSHSDKIKDDFQWCKDVADSLFIDYSSNYDRDYNRKLSNYQLYNNVLNQLDFERECNPLGLSIGQFQDTIQPYNKTYNKIQVLLGEELRRPFNYKVVLINDDGIKSKLAHRDKMLQDYVMSKVNAVISQVYPDVQDVGEVLPPEEIAKFMSTKYLDSREITASKLLSYLVRHMNVKDKKNDSFKHALLSGEEVVFVGMENGEPTVTPLNSLGIFYHKSPETKYIQDGLYAGYRTYMTSADVLDKFGSYLTEEEKKKIDNFVVGPFATNKEGSHPDMRYDFKEYLDHNHIDVNNHGSYQGSTRTASSANWLVQHVEWRSQKKVGFIMFKNEYGDSQTEIVSEDYAVPANATSIVATEEFNKKVKYYMWIDETGNEFKLNWDWIPEIWTATRIGSDVYCMMGPKQYQFRSLDNPYNVKLGYHGLAYNAMNASPIALMDRMKPFQYLYFIVMHKLKKFIAQDKGKIFHLDASMIDPKLNWEKTLYYLTEMNLDIFNPLQNAEQPGAFQRGKVSGSTDMSSAEHISHYMEILQAIDQQISDVAGVSRQREGQISPNEAVTNAQANAELSAVITEVYFYPHNKLWEEILTSLVQTAQTCYKNKSAVKQFILDDMSLQTLELTPDSLVNSDFGVFVSDSSKDNQVFESIKSLSQPLIQNDKAKFSDIITLLKATSIEELERDIRTAEDQFTKEQQQMQQQQYEAQAKLQKDQQDFELLLQKNLLDNKITLAEIDSFKFQMDQDSDDDGMPDQLEIEKFKVDTALKTRKLDLEEKKINKMSYKSSK